jgi:hypothetical protein
LAAAQLGGIARIDRRFQCGEFDPDQRIEQIMQLSARVLMAPRSKLRCS